MEIGSIYEVNPALAETAGAEDGGKLSLAEVRKYGKEYCVYTASCREAIALALKSLEEHREDIPKRCLLPAYMCDSVFIPFVRAGWELHFYHIDKRLAVRAEELCRRIDEVRPGLLFIHPYYGVDTWKAVRPLFRGWKAQGICIMEDVTQSYYLDGAGAEADYVVGSLRKWYPVPDGGFVASKEWIPDKWLEGEAAYVKMRLEALEEKWRYLNGAGSSVSVSKSLEERQKIKAKFLEKNREAEGELDRYQGITGLSHTAEHILKETDEEAAKERRRENYRYLYGKLCGKTRFSPVLQMGEEGAGMGTGSTREEGAAPLYFAVYVKEREKLQEYLRERDIYAPVLWPVGTENGGDLSEDETYIYGHILALPMDQRYGMEEMRRIAEVMEEYERQAAGTMWTEGSGGFLPVVGIRADANETVATGHVMRCITIARQLKRRGARVVFFTADEYGREWLDQAGMDMVCLQSDWKHMEDEIFLLRKELKRTGCKKLLVDSYQVSADYFERLKDLCKLIYIDDCFDGIYPVDMLVNYNAYQVRFPYGEAYHGKAKLLLGTSYVPLRDEFDRQARGDSRRIIPGGEGSGKNSPERRAQEETAGETGESRFYGKEEAGKETGKETGAWEMPGKEPGQEVRHILISSGGGDRYDALWGILAGAAADEGFQGVIFHTVVGKFHNRKEELERLAAGYPNIRLHREVRNMSELMEACCAAVSAAGTMLFELSAMGVPTVFFVSADNQQYDSEFFAAEDRMLFAGDIREDRSGCIRRICDGLKRVLGDVKLQEHMRKALHSVTDGRGAERIAQAILEL